MLEEAKGGIRSPGTGAADGCVGSQMVGWVLAMEPRSSGRAACKVQDPENVPKGQSLGLGVWSLISQIIWLVLIWAAL